MIKSLWNGLASTRLCFWLLNLLTVNLVIGGLYTSSDSRYRQINTQLFPDWLQNNFDGDCWWLISLMLLLTVLTCNIAACAAQRMAQLWQHRQRNSWQMGILLLCPTLMHLCFILIISGHALSEFSGLKTKLIGIPGQQISIGSTVVDVLDSKSIFYPEGVLKGKLQSSEVSLQFSDGVRSITHQLQVLKPLRHNGVGYHLVMSSKVRGDRAPRLLVMIKQDPGLRLIAIGNTVMCLLMAAYFLVIRKSRQGDNI